MNKILLAILTMTLVGCGHFTKLENVYIDNSAVNNYVGNPCAFFVNDKCIYMKPTARNPDTK
jgi:hypothetical protein